MLGLVDGGTQRQHQPFARHLQHIEARLACRRFQVGPRRPAELQDLQSVIDQHPRRSELADGDPVGLALRVEFAAETVRRFHSIRQARLPDRKRPQRSPCGSLGLLFPGRHMKPRGRRGLLGEDLMLPVHRLEEACEPADGFRGAQQQVSVGFERVMERGHRLLLQARLEIDEEISATDEVHA